MKYLLTGVIMMVSDCVNGRVPSHAEMRRIETAIEDKWCVGRLDDWDRHYLYQWDYIAEGEIRSAMKEGRNPRPYSYNKNIVIIQVYKRGVEGFRKGRRSYAVSPYLWDDREHAKHLIGEGYFRLDSGEYAVSCSPKSCWNARCSNPDITNERASD